ncbi:hypothetical protein KNO81_39735 [Paraburkholderia sediminicola]|nr:hypothetical protein [Paraburkholderia sediminicola]
MNRATIARGGSLGRNIGAISMDAVAATIGSLVVDNVQAASLGKTGTNGSVSALYGFGGSAADFVAQSGYGASGGDQFANMAGRNLALAAGEAGVASVGVRDTGFAINAGASPSLDQIREQRIAAMQAQAANPADVGWAPRPGEYNILVTGVGSRNDPNAYGEMRAVPWNRRAALNDPSVADTPGGALLGFGYNVIEHVIGNTAALFSPHNLNPVSGEVLSPGQLQRTKEDLVINAGAFGIGAVEGEAAALVRQQGQVMLRSAGETFGPTIDAAANSYFVRHGMQLNAVPPGEMKLVANSAEVVFKDFNQAQKAALEWLDARGFKAEQPTLAKFGDNAGTLIGMKSADGRVGFRVEYDARSGAHINVFAGV